MPKNSEAFIPLNICILTVSDTREFENDTSGKALADAVQEAGHQLNERAISKDDIYQIRAIVSPWVYDESIHAILVTGGTGFSGRDSTPEAIEPLFDKDIPGFGELFRSVSFEEIGTSTIQSRAFAGLANFTTIFCLPGSTGACITGWEKIISPQLDSRTKPCNFVGHLTNH